MLEAILTAAFVYQAVAFFLLGSWKEAMSHEVEELKFSYIFSSILAAAFWPFVVIWYFVTRKK